MCAWHSSHLSLCSQNRYNYIKGKEWEKSKVASQLEDNIWLQLYPLEVKTESQIIGTFFRLWSLKNKPFKAANLQVEIGEFLEIQLSF